MKDKTQIGRNFQIYVAEFIALKRIGYSSGFARKQIAKAHGVTEVYLKKIPVKKLVKEFKLEDC